MSDTILVYNPTAQSRLSVQGVSVPWNNLQGRVVGVIDNAKPNFDVLAKHLTRILQERHGVRKVVYQTKRAPTIGAPGEMYQGLAATCDLVITGSGD